MPAGLPRQMWYSNRNYRNMLNAWAEDPNWRWSPDAQAAAETHAQIVEQADAAWSAALSAGASNAQAMAAFLQATKAAAAAITSPPGSPQVAAAASLVAAAQSAVNSFPPTQTQPQLPNQLVSSAWLAPIITNLKSAQLC